MNNRVTKPSFARLLRKNQTEAEKLLWSRLRNRQVEGIKFRRQEPIGKYIVDFVSIEKKIIIELDGGQHNTNYMQLSDEKRTSFLQEQGYTVIRIWNNDIFNNMSAVLEHILFSLTQPSPKGEGY